MEIPGWLIGVAGLALSLAAMVPYALRIRRQEQQAEEAELAALRYGLNEPVTLHPVIDAERCMGSGACVAVCPESVLAIRNGQASAIAAARCIGHGLCETACPTEAIKLVFGSSRRGVDLPRIKGNFETNVPGIYIVGELGGMGLIRNAFEQGRQCIDGIVKESRSRNGADYDVVIVGCGPAGLSASLNCLHEKLRFLTIEKEDVGGTVRYYPRKKLVMTSAVKVPGYGKLNFREVQKEDLIEVWEDIIRKTGLQVRTNETVREVKRRTGSAFEVVTAEGCYSASRVILAIGRRGVPRKLGVPGEDSAAVAYALREPEAYNNDRIVVVGGGDSAIEAALALAEQPGNVVRLSYRGENFARVKEKNLERIQAAAAKGQIELLMSTHVVEIGSDFVRYKTGAGAEQRIANDRVFVFIGGELPTKFLADCGVEMVTKFGTA
jgi:thioredoxin reductase/Pyruvate/2-oxoacid:ferredoxin oxidoreductase delta subunit